MLNIKNLSIDVNKKNILNNINMIVNSGELHVIMGLNGSGKSTLSRAIIGDKNIKINKGKIFFLKKDITNIPIHERACMGIYVSFQNPVEIPGISSINFIISSLNEIRKYNNLKELSFNKIKYKIDKYCKIINLNPELLYKPININFSGGEKKKHEILQFSLLKPKLSILDEIDSGLDIDSIKGICNIINDFIKLNRSIIIITHYDILFKYLKPNFIHIINNKKIITSNNLLIIDNIIKYGYKDIYNRIKKLNS